ncbi:MAG TPA: class I SAM-dependent methyltransferase [Flavobacteriales bacterium]|nr:class I SAM-dependent methyltransferase [Flavobacteriales bacterium]HPH80991.1 class I SAM-dependent methyltransferase [Flavobacteriales bacterium]
MATQGLREQIVKVLSGNPITENLILKPVRNYRIRKHYEELMLLKDLSPEQRQHWADRIRITKLSTDNQKINKIPTSGKLIDGKLHMHNGLVIDPLSYYGPPMLRLLMENHAVHEPQEEYVFQEVLKNMKPGAVMLELGCYWGFYSMWFASKVKNAKNFLIDNGDGIARAKGNFAMNKLNATFMVGYIGKDVAGSEPPVTNVDRICEQQKIDFVDILHADIQGFEMEMLETMPILTGKKGIGYIFISTHSEELHSGCIAWLKDHGYIIICDANLEHTFSEDGLIVARDPSYPGIEPMAISQYQRT